MACSVNPARRLGLYPRKGCIAVGSDADLVMVDLGLEKTIRGDMSFAKTHWTPYEGWSTVGAPITTIVGGVPVFLEEDRHLLVHRVLCSCNFVNSHSV